MGAIDVSKDVLHAQPHAALTSEEIAKALARHQREHKGDVDKAARIKTAPKKK